MFVVEVIGRRGGGRRIEGETFEAQALTAKAAKQAAVKEANRSGYHVVSIKVREVQPASEPVAEPIVA